MIVPLTEIARSYNVSVKTASSHLLLELCVRLKAAGMADDMSFEMPLTQEFIGDALGLTTVHVNRTLSTRLDVASAHPQA